MKIAILFFALILLSPFKAQAALTDNQLSYWKFDESSGNAVDATGNGQTLTNTGTITYGLSSGKINNGASLNGSSQYFTRTSISSIALPYSINMWVNEQTRHSNADPALASLIWIFSDSGGNFAEVSSNNGVLYYAGTAATAWHSTGYTLPLATWTMLTFTVTSTNFTIYANGVSVFSTSTEPPAALSTTFYLGSWKGTQGYFAGYMDETYIVGKTFTAPDISTLYNGGAGCQYAFLNCGVKFAFWQFFPF